MFMGHFGHAGCSWRFVWAGRSSDGAWLSAAGPTCTTQWVCVLGVCDDIIELYLRHDYCSLLPSTA